MLSPSEKSQLIKQHRIHGKDTGSAAVQIAILNEQIQKLSVHLRQNLKDIVCRRVLLAKVAQRKRLQKYLASQ